MRSHQSLNDKNVARVGGWVCCAALSLAGACGGKSFYSPPPPPDCTVAVVILLPEAGTIRVGETLRVAANVNAVSGVCVGLPVTWESLNSTIATVSTGSNVTGAGKDAPNDVTGIAPGRASIVARSGAKADTAVVTVQPPLPDFIDITGVPRTISVGVPISLTATVKDGAGRVRTGRRITWSVGDAGVVTPGPGSAWTKCADEGANCAFTGSKLVRFGSANAFYYKELSNGTPCTSGVFGNFLIGVAKECAVAERLTNAGGATTLYPVGPGLTKLTLTSPDDAALATSVDLQVQASGLIVDYGLFPNTFPTTLDSAEFVRLTPVPFDSVQNALKLGVRTQTSDANVIRSTTNADGSVTLSAGVAGSATVTFGPPFGVTGPSISRPFTVRPPVAFIAVSAPQTTLAPGQSTQATAVLRDAQGNVLTGRRVGWRSKGPRVSVDSLGRVVAVAAGADTVEALAGTAIGRLGFLVQDPVSTVSVSVAKTVIASGESMQATATANDAQGNVLTGRRFSWASSHPAIATVDSFGVVRGVAPGAATIMATSEGKTGARTITVSSPVNSVTITAPQTVLPIGVSIQLTATLRDANGIVIVGPVVNWSTTNGSVVTVNASGQVTGLDVGTATIIATADGITGTIVLTVASSLRVRP